MEPSTQKLFDDALRHYQAGQLAEAAQLFEKILAIDSAHVDSLNYLGVISYRRDRFDEAAAFYNRILAARPHHAEAHNFLGSTLYKLGRIDEAAAACGRAVAISPDFAEAHYNQGFFLAKQGRHRDAAACYDHAIAIRPHYADAHYSKASSCLLLGDFGNGWREYEWRWHTGEIKPHGFTGPLWDGKDLRGKTLLLHCEQGMGDNIQFIRYAALIEKSGGRVLLACPPPLVRLFSDVDGIDEVLEIPADGFKSPAYDWQAPLLSLPGIMGTTLETIPTGGAYLHPDAALENAWRERLAPYPGLRVGVVWRGNPTHRNDRNRSMTPAQFSEFLGLQGLTIVSLQKDATEDEIKALGAISPVFDAGLQLTDFADTAALIDSLDLVITVDTSICHLAGALGVPVWNLIPFAPDWRWLLERADSPWYPSMRLFRQPMTGDWQSVAAQVREVLREKIGTGVPNTQILFEDALRRHRAGQFAEAETLYRKVLAIDPRHADSLHCLGAIAYQGGRNDEAADLMQQAIQYKQGEPSFHYNLGRVLSKQGKLEEAAACYRCAVALNPDFAEAHSNLGGVLDEQGKFDEAVANCQRAIAINPNLAEAYSNLGTIFYKQDKLGEAVTACQRALAIRPDYAEAHYNLGRAYSKQNRIDDALACYKQAITINKNFAEAHFSAAEGLLRSGDYINGWREYEWRWRTRDIAPHGFSAPLWDGKNLDGKTILLHCEQGLGDSIQFIRYARLVEEKNGRVLLSCPPSLVNLFKSGDGIDEIVTTGQKTPPHDCRAPLMSLPYLLQTTRKTIPADVPYLNADPAQEKVWKDRLAENSGFKVGVVWRGRPEHKDNRNRSMRPEQFSEFLGIPGISIISLQKDATEQEIAALGGTAFNAGPLLGDFTDTAALIANLDLVIAVDTSVCHLAGALGTPVWSLIRFSPDWRWLRDREDTPWYPSMRLFTQPKAGDWQSVINSVREALAARAADLGKIKSVRPARGS